MSVVLELRHSAQQTAFNLKRWEEVHADPYLANLQRPSGRISGEWTPVQRQGASIHTQPCKQRGFSDHSKSCRPQADPQKHVYLSLAPQTLI
jgi:hypothetical protein